MRLFTMLFLPVLLLGCGRAIAAYDVRQPEGFDLSFLKLSDAQLERLTRRLAMPFYSAAAAAMFLFAMVLSLFCGERPVFTGIACVLAFVALEIGTLSYLYYVVRRE